MLNDQRDHIGSTSRYNNNQEHEDEDEHVRDIHALTPPLPPPPAGRRREAWETSSHRSSNISMSSEVASSENFTTMSREFNALVLAGSTVANNGTEDNASGMGSSNLGRIGEEELEEETNPLAIVPDNNPTLSQLMSSRRDIGPSNNNNNNNNGDVVSVQRVKKEEVESKIGAWQTAKVAKINNRFKREDAVISGWENEEVQKATTWMKKVERKLEEKRAKAMEKMQNNIAKAHRKAEERRASAEAKRGTKVARVLELANLMKAVGRPPVKRSFFK